MDQEVRDAMLERPGLGVWRDRDHELVCYVGRHGAVTVDDVMRATGVGRTMAYRRVARCVEAGLLERLAVLRTEPALLRATREGLHYAGLGLPVAEVSPGSVMHWLRCATVAHLLREHYGAERVLTEREIAYAERLERQPLASAEVGRWRSGARRLHRPDLAVLTDAGVLAIEIELTAKSPSRLERIMTGWLISSWVSEVHYLSPAGQTHRAVQRAITASSAQSKVSAIDRVPW